MRKINSRFTAKRHAHLQTLINTSAKFQKDPAKTVGGVAFTRFNDGQSGRQTDRQRHVEKQYVSQPWTGRHNYAINGLAHSENDMNAR